MRAATPQAASATGCELAPRMQGVRDLAAWLGGDLHRRPARRAEIVAGRV